MSGQLTCIPCYFCWWVPIYHIDKGAVKTEEAASAESVDRVLLSLYMKCCAKCHIQNDFVEWSVNSHLSFGVRTSQVWRIVYLRKRCLTNDTWKSAVDFSSSAPAACSVVLSLASHWALVFKKNLIYLLAQNTKYVGQSSDPGRQNGIAVKPPNDLSSPSYFLSLTTASCSYLQGGPVMSGQVRPICNLI